MRRTKDRAISQFDKTAAPISLGLQFNNFTSFNINPNVVDDENDELDYPSLFTNEIISLPVTTESLTLIANDLDPMTRDAYAKEVKQSESATSVSLKQSQDLKSDSITLASDLPAVEIEIEQDLILPDQQQVVEPNLIQESPPVDVSSNKFKIKHAEIKRELTGFQPVNKVTTAFRLVNLAIDKMSSQHKSRFKLDELEKNHFHATPGTALIDKSITSVKFINQLGKRVLTLLAQQYPARFAEFPEDEKSEIDWLNSNIGDKKIDFLILSSVLAKRIKFSHIELNSFIGLDCGLKNSWKYITSHQVLGFLNLSTIDISSVAFSNFEKFVLNFSKVHNGTRLYYLEYLISEARQKNLFFDSKHVKFFDGIDERYSNHDFRLFNVINDYWIDNYILKRDH